MAYREVNRVEINEVIRRWQLGLSQRQIVRGTGLSRPTVRGYLAAAVELGLSADGPEPGESQLARPAALSLAGPRRTDAPSEEQPTPWAEQIQVWLTAERVQMTRIHELLRERGCAVSYNSLRRFIQRRGWRRCWRA